jgi:hypothetical protein
MNHAFFQTAITTAPDFEQSPDFLVAQENMKDAIIDITEKLGDA